jgi:hypothetical protein
MVFSVWLSPTYFACHVHAYFKTLILVITTSLLRDTVDVAIIPVG